MPTKRMKKPALRLTRDQCRAVDRYAIETLGVPSLVLMENAGRNAADCIQRWLRARTKRGHLPRRSLRRSLGRPSQGTPGQIIIVCGKGNNGGDGFVIARHLANRGYDVSIDLAGKESELSDDAAINHAIAQKMAIPIRPLNDKRELASAARRWRSSAVIVDAMLGTGIRGAARGHLADVIERINATGGPLIVAIDVPSGLDVDTGEAPGPAIRADHTVSFLAPKVGYQKRSARPHVGRVTVVDIGVPTEWILDRLDHPSS